MTMIGIGRNLLSVENESSRLIFEQKNQARIRLNSWFSLSNSSQRKVKAVNFLSMDIHNIRGEYDS